MKIFILALLFSFLVGNVLAQDFDVEKQTITFIGGTITQFEFTFYHMVKDRQGKDVEVSYKTERATLEELETELAEIQAKIDAAKALIK